MSKRIGKYLVGIAAVCGAFIGTLLLLSTSETGSKFLSDKLRAHILAATDIDISFRNIDLDLLPPRIRVVDIQAADNQQRILCTAEEIEFAPMPLELLRGNLNIEEVYIGSPICQVLLNEENIDKLLQYFERDSKSKANSDFDFSMIPSFEVFAVSSASLKAEIDDPKRLGQISAYLDGFGLDVTGGESKIEIRALLKEAAVKWKKGENQVFERLVQLDLRAALTPESFDVRHLKTQIAGAEITIRDARVPIPIWPGGPEISDLSLTVPLEMFDRFPLGLPTMFGTVGYLGQVALRKDIGDKIGVSARGQVSLDRGVIDEFVIGDLVGMVSLTPRGVSFAETEIRTAEGLLHARGNIEFDDQLSTNLNLNLDQIELAHLLEQLTVSDCYVTQRMTGPINLAGTLHPFRLTGTMQVDVEDHTVNLGSFRSKNPDIAISVPRVGVAGDLIITDTFISGKNLLVQTGSTRIQTSLDIEFDTEKWKLIAQSDDFHMEDVKKLVGFDVAGHGPLDCTITGLLSEPIIKGQFDFEKFAFAGFFIDKASARVRYRDGVLGFHNLKTKRKIGEASTEKLILDFNSEDSLHLTSNIDAQHIRVQDVLNLFQVDSSSFGTPSGVVTGRIAVDYALKPNRLKVDADLEHSKASIFKERFGPGALRFNWDDGALTVSKLSLKKGGGNIAVQGNVGIDQSLNFEVVAQGIPSSSFDTPELKNLNLKTTLELSAKLDGTLKHPLGKGDVRFGETTYKNKRYGGSLVHLSLNGSEISGEGTIAGKKVILNGLDLNIDTKRFKIRGAVKNLDIIPVTNIQFEEHQASLSITGEVVLGGKLDKNPDLTGQATLGQVKMKFDNLRFKNKQPLNIVTEANRFRIQDTRFEGPEVVFDLGGTLSLEELDIKSRGQVNLNATSDMFSWMADSKGLLDFEIRARGSYDDPNLRGKADLSAGMVKIVQFPYRLENISGKAVLSPKIIRFDDFKATTAGGTIRASGDIQLDGGEVDDYRFQLQAENLQMSLIEDVTFKASTTKDGIILKAPTDGTLPLIFGDVEIKRLRYTQDIRIFELSDLSVDRLSGSRSRASRPKLVDAKNDLFRFDVNLHGDSNIEARNNLFDADLAIDDVEKPLRMVGTNQIFGFLGRVKGKKGEVRFAGKRFDIKYASIEFQDPTRPSNPHFRVTADGQIRDWRVTMTAEGSVEEYELKFSSQPYLPKEDIIFVILTGFTRAEQRQFGGSSLSIGAPLLGQFGPSTSGIPLEFRVYNDYSESSGTESTRVELGRWITPDVWVSVSSGVGDNRDVEADVDYKINDELSVSAGYENDNEGSVGNVGLDLKYRLEF